jgi:hypothetical protein
VVGAMISVMTDSWPILLIWSAVLGGQVVKWVTDAIPKLGIELGKWSAALVNYLANTALPDLVRSAGFLAGAATRWIVDAAEAIPGKIGEFWHAITGWFDQTGKPGIKQQGQNLIDSLFDGLKRLIEDGPRQVKQWVDHLVDVLLSGFREGWGVKSPSSKMIEIAGHLIDGLVAGLDPGKLLAKIKDVAAGALTQFTKIFDSHSPSEETKKIGGYVLDGLTLGMDGGAAALDAAFTRIRGTFATFKTDLLAQTTTALSALPPLWQTNLDALIPVWDRLFGADAGLAGTLLNRLWGHQADSFFSTLVAYTHTKNDQWFQVVWVADLDLLASRLTDYLKLKAGEISVGGVEVGKQIDLGIAQGIDENTPAIEAAARHAVQAGISAAKAEAESHSPSEKAAREVGRPLGQGTAKGIIDSTGEVEDAMRAQVRAAVGVGVPTGGGPAGLPVGGTAGGLPVGVPLGAGGGGGANAPALNATFQITIQGSEGELRGPRGERASDPAFWTPYLRAIRIEWARQFGLTPEGRGV